MIKCLSYSLFCLLKLHFDIDTKYEQTKSSFSNTCLDYTIR